METADFSGEDVLDRDGRFVLPLGGVRLKDAARAGAKAANLGEMLAAGFPVPKGFVLTTDAFEHFRRANSLEGRAVPDVVLRATVPSEIRAALQAAAAALGDVAVAVRSSGIAEDLPGASFAGQYETVLDVRGSHALLAAVVQCWASAFAGRIATYSARKGTGVNGGMAVLVQEMISADAAGVAFTANPVTGDRTETLVSAVRGLGDRLVSGLATPDEWVVQNGNVLCRRSNEKAVDTDQVQAVADLARRVEQHYGTPQDIEWAFAGDRLFLLQTRPITALPEFESGNTNQGLSAAACPAVDGSASVFATAPLPGAPDIEPVPVPVEPPPGTWERESAHFSEPFSPFMRSAILPVHERATNAVLKEMSLPIERAEFREIGGWVYWRMVPLGGKDMAPPPQWLMPLIIRLIPAMRRMTKGMTETIRADKAGASVERWYTEWKPMAIHRAAELGGTQPELLTDGDLQRHFEEVVAFASECVLIHSLVTATDFLVAELVLLCQDKLGWDSGKSLQLFAGLSTTTTDASKRISDLADMARTRPEVGRLLSRVDTETVGRLSEVDTEFAAAFQSYLRDFGRITVSWEVADATMAERPELILGLIQAEASADRNRDADAAAARKEREAAVEEARSLLAEFTTADRELFDWALARAERAYPIREDHERHLSNVPFALLRYALLEIGRRMVDRVVLETPEDIFFLEINEICSAFHDETDHRLLVRRRKGELAWVKAHPGPSYYGKAPSPPPLVDAFPPEAKRLMRGLFWMIEGMMGPPGSGAAEPSGTELRGLGASPGRYTGPARIIKGEAEFGKLQTGDVLVCPTTQPPWTVLFPKVGALVTDGGGVLSHPAIIAREYRVPAVLATGNATTLLGDGQIVTVDGSLGEVIVGPRAQ